MPTRDELIGTLNTLSDGFHRIAMSIDAEKMLAEDSKRIANMNPKLADAIKERQLTDEQRVELCTTGFETCVRMLVQLGSPDASIHSCNPAPDDPVDP